MKKLALLGMLALAACAPEPEQTPMTSPENKTIMFTMDYPDLIEKIPEGEVATQMTDSFGLMRMFVNGKDAGPIKVNGTVKISVPSDASTIQLRSSSFPGTKRASEEIDISRFGSGEIINIRGEFSLFHPDMLELKVIN